jgi:hypothetical protein
MPGVTGLGFRDPVPTVGTGPIHVYPTFFLGIIHYENKKSMV